MRGVRDIGGQGGLLQCVGMLGRGVVGLRWVVWGGKGCLWARLRKGCMCCMLAGSECSVEGLVQGLVSVFVLGGDGCFVQRGCDWKDPNGDGELLCMGYCLMACGWFVGDRLGLWLQVWGGVGVSYLGICPLVRTEWLCRWCWWCWRGWKMLGEFWHERLYWYWWCGGVQSVTVSSRMIDHNMAKVRVGRLRPPTDLGANIRCEGSLDVMLYCLRSLEGWICHCWGMFIGRCLGGEDCMLQWIWLVVCIVWLGHILVGVVWKGDFVVCWWRIGLCMHGYKCCLSWWSKLRRVCVGQW